MEGGVEGFIPGARRRRVYLCLEDAWQTDEAAGLYAVLISVLCGKVVGLMQPCWQTSYKT